MNNIKPKKKKMLDNIHYNLSKICSYNKAFNFVISEREAGKSTAIWLLIWRKFRDGHPSLVIRRRVIDITAQYINDTLKIYNKFVKDFEMDKVRFKDGDCKNGIVDVFYDDQLLFRVIGLSKPLYALKGLIIEDIGMILFDEFICNVRAGEKYLKDESLRFKEVYNTFQRECDGVLRAFFMGNPYSLYNPYFSWIGVDTALLHPGAFITGKNWVIECYQITQALRDYILAHNPLYEFDDAYTRYAFNGIAVNDTNIRINKERPQAYKLKYAFRIDGNFLGIFENNDVLDFDNKFYIDKIDEISARKKTFCFDFGDLMEHTALISLEDRFRFAKLKSAFRERKIVFNNLECYYLVEEVYSTL